MVRTLLDVPGVQRVRLKQLTDSREITQRLTDAVALVGGSPTSALFDLASRGLWERLGRSAARRKVVLRRSVADELRRSSDEVEALWPVAASLTLDRPYVASTAELMSQVELELEARGIDKSFARRAFQGNRSPHNRPLIVASAAVREAWSRTLRRDCEFNLVQAVAHFNMARGSNIGNANDSSAAVDKVRDFLAESIADVGKKLKEVRVGSAAGAASFRVLAASNLLAGTVIPALRAQANFPLNDRESIDRAVDLADSTKELLWLIAALRIVAWRCTWPEVGNAALLTESASSHPLRATRSVLKPLTAARMRNTATSNDLVALTGVVRSLEVRHENGKPVTDVTVASTADDVGPGVAVRVYGFKADSTGCVVGAAIRLAGTWVPASTTEEGYFSVARSKLTADKDTSFEAYLRWATRNVYMPMTHGLRIHSSWVAGADGPINPFRYGVTAREE